jgi:hypothetical protein
MYCSPVLLPFLCGRENLGHRKNAALLGLFLGGRLAMYAALALILGAAGLLGSEIFDPVLARFLSRRGFLICGLVLGASALLPRLARDRGRPCVQACARAAAGPWGERGTALFSGLGAGLHLCPPFWIAAARCISAASSGGLAGPLAYFLLFYAGTLPFFLPLTGLPFFVGKLPFLRKSARICQALVGLYLFVFAGLLPIVTGGAG